jgi:hypothetical protein
MHADGRLVISYLLREDFHELAADEDDAEGIIDVLRGTTEAEMAALIREPPSWRTLRVGLASREQRSHRRGRDRT